VSGSRVTVYSAVLASAVGVYAGVESDVRAVVIGYNRSSSVLIKFRPGRNAFRYLLLGRLVLDLLEAVGEVFRGAPASNARNVTTHGFTPRVRETAVISFMQKV
jgi:hypothetical protein